jgi:hypothetical protein
MTQIDIVEHYRHLRDIAANLQDDALALVQHSTMLEFGRRLGVVRSGELWVDPREAKLVYDIAIHTARPGRSRAIDRYARTAAFPLRSDEARILAALQDARFTTFQIEARHPVAGATAYDLLAKQSFHLMDVSIGLSAEAKSCFAGRLVEVDGFHMSCLTVVPMYRELMEQAKARLPSVLPGTLTEAFQDPRCAIALYRAAIELGYMRRTVSFDVVKQVPTAESVAAVQGISGRQLEDWPILTAAE